MVRALFVLLFPVFAFASNCDSLFDERHDGRDKSVEALSCYEANQGAARKDKAHALSRISYLKFYIAEFFTEKKSNLLLEAISHAEKGMLLFGTKYDVAAYSKLPADEKSVVAELLYNYGLTTSRYIDLAGPLEAIRRMEDIKKSMNSIIRMKEESVSFFGAHRTLGIFHMKVPAIAGGDIKLSEQYLVKAVNSTIAYGSMSAYPSNNLYLAELYLKLNQDQKACGMLSQISALTDNDIVKLANGHILESRQSVKKAAELMEKKCR